MTDHDLAPHSFADDAATLYETAPCGFLSTTPNGEIYRVNETFLRWTGYTQDELLGVRRITDLLTGGGRIYHETHLSPLLRMQDFVREIALDIVCREGRRLPVLLNAVMQRDSQGRPQALQFAIFDATERRGYERELLREKRRAEDSEQHARSLARTLQQTLIPPTPPDIPGLDIAAAYRPAGTGTEVGGDFYDVFQIGQDDWVVALGDVCGKGVDAAVITALVRYTLRAAAARLIDPAEVLDDLNRTLLRHGTDRYATVVVLRLTRVGEAWSVASACGGHPLPILLPPSGPVGYLGRPGTLIGVFESPSFHDAQAVLGEGSTLVLYTDGVTEARRGRELYGDDRLLACLGARHASSTAVVDAVLGEILAFQGTDPRDDIALIAVRVGGVDGGVSATRMEHTPPA